MRTLALALTSILILLASPRSALADSRSGPYSLEILDEGGNALPTFEHRGRTYVLGALGQRYLIRVNNRSWRRVEVVVSVDGRDVVDGRPSAWEKRGYVVAPRGEVVVDGFRLNEGAVAAFRFSSVPRSYASRMGDGRNVGVIGVAVFPEREPRLAVTPGYSRQRDLPSGAAPAPEAPAANASKSAEGAGADVASAGRPRGAVARNDARRAERPGLGTEFGEERVSQVFSVRFERATSRPAAVLSLRYNDRKGLLALGIDVDGPRWGYASDTWLRETAEPFPRDPRYSEPPPGWRP